MRTTTTVRRRGLWTAASILGAMLSVRASLATDWPQWRGPARNGVSSEVGLQWRWPGSGPRRVWSTRVGDGFSSVAVVGGRVYTMGNAGGKDTVYCLNAGTGRAVWTQSYPCGSGDYSGPRATPSVDGGRVYTLSREGLALCFDAVSGRIIWQRDIARDAKARPPQWGFAGSPLVDGNLVLYNVGTAGVALNRATGRPVWISGDQSAGYASPVAFNAGRQRGAAFFVAWGIVAVNPANGRPLWQYPWQTAYGVNAADPIFSGDTVFISSNYDTGCALMRIGGARPSVVWQNRSMRNHFNSCVLVGSYLYGNDQNTLKCIDLKNGNERWQLRGIGKGGLIAADGKLIILTERGELIVAAASPDRFTQLAKAKVLETNMAWTHPVLANGFIYCRSHEGELVCLDVRGRG